MAGTNDLSAYIETWDQPSFCN